MKNNRIWIKLLCIAMIIFLSMIICNVKSFAENNSEERIVYLMQLFEEQGLTKDGLTEAIKTYKDVSKEYTNEEIATMIENNKDKIKSDGQAKENIDNICKVLKNVDKDKLNAIIEKTDMEQVISEVEDGATLLDIVNKTTANMSTREKVSLMVSIAWSANIIRIITRIVIVLAIYKLFVRCVIYKKAKKRAWAVLIPIYKDVVMLQICGMSSWWLLLLLVPVVGWIILWLVHVASRFMLAEAFDKRQAYGLGLWLLWPVFESILAFSKKSKYVGIEK